MKYIPFQKALTGACALMVCSLISLGQDREPNAGVSLGKQYRDNAVPGMQYAPAKAGKLAKRKAVNTLPENHSESSGMQLKKGTMPGMQYAGGAAAGKTTFRKSSAAKVAGGGQPLSSEQPATKPAVKAAVAPAVPMQEGQAPQEKAVIAPKTKTTPAQAAKQQPAGRE